MVGSTSMKKPVSESQEAMKSILVVDDEPLIREILHRQLKKEGFVVTACENGKDAVASFKKSEPDVILSDIRMPNGDGMFLLDEVMKIKNNFPFLLMTGFTDVPSYDVYHKGASALVKKPFDLDAIVEIIKASLVPNKTRWSKSPTAAKDDLTLAFESLDSALKDQSLSWGRGGFSFTKNLSFHSGDKVGFTINFQSGPVNQIKGLGVVRWNLGSSPQGYQKVGVEISSLDADSLEPVVKLVEEQGKASYIPARLPM